MGAGYEVIGYSNRLDLLQLLFIPSCHYICVFELFLQVFTKGPSLYAFKGLAGRYAPIGVHLAMLFIMAGATLSATGSFKGSVDVPQGLNFVIGDVMKPRGALSVAPDVFNTEVHVNRFYMEYYDSGEVFFFNQDSLRFCDCSN